MWTGEWPDKWSSVAKDIQEVDIFSCLRIEEQNVPFALIVGYFIIS